MAAIRSESCVSGSLVAARVRGLCTVLVTKTGAVADCQSRRILVDSRVELEANAAVVAKGDRDEVHRRIHRRDGPIVLAVLTCLGFGRGSERRGLRVTCAASREGRAGITSTSRYLAAIVAMTVRSTPGPTGTLLSLSSGNRATKPGSLSRGGASSQSSRETFLKPASPGGQLDSRFSGVGEGG